MNLARGKFGRTRFWLTRREVEVTWLNEVGGPACVKQVFTTVDADINIGVVLDVAKESSPAMLMASDCVPILAPVFTEATQDKGRKFSS
jgi:hypothetical protein